jgi:hypothetical protein
MSSSGCGFLTQTRSSLRVSRRGWRCRASERNLGRCASSKGLTGSGARPRREGWPTGTRGMAYWDCLAKILSEEPVREVDKIMMAMIEPLGIVRDQPFKPDARQTRILTEAAALGELMMRNNSGTSSGSSCSRSCSQLASRCSDARPQSSSQESSTAKRCVTSETSEPEPTPARQHPHHPRPPTRRSLDPPGATPRLPRPAGASRRSSD